MAAHTVRPRILAAISALGSFTVPDLCKAAGLNDRKEAYPQLNRLQEEGFLEKEQLPAVGRHRPLSLYKLTANITKRQQFAEELERYRPPEPDAGLATASLAEANHALDRAQVTLNELELSISEDAAERLNELDSALQDAETDIGTALLEHDDAAKSAPQHPAIITRTRWSEIGEKVRELKTRVAIRTFIREAAEMVRQISVSPSASHEAIESLNRDENVDAIRKLLIDEIRADMQRGDVPMAPLLRHALRTHDPKLFDQLFRTLANIEISWWKYNTENIRYLRSLEFDLGSWLNAYREFSTKIQTTPRKHYGFEVYSYEIGELTEETYLELGRERCISVISPKELSFLAGLSVVLRPTLIITNGNMFQPLECTFLDPEHLLYAYGPIANEVGFWAGAPILRMAACFANWGLSLHKISKIMGAVKLSRGLLIAEGRVPSRMLPIEKKHFKLEVEADTSESAFNHLSAQTARAGK